MQVNHCHHHLQRAFLPALLPLKGLVFGEPPYPPSELHASPRLREWPHYLRTNHPLGKSGGFGRSWSLEDIDLAGTLTAFHMFPLGFGQDWQVMRTLFEKSSESNVWWWCCARKWYILVDRCLQLLAMLHPPHPKILPAVFLFVALISPGLPEKSVTWLGELIHGITGKDEQGLPKYWQCDYRKEILGELVWSNYQKKSVVGNLWLPEKCLTNSFGNLFGRGGGRCSDILVRQKGQFWEHTLFLRQMRPNRSQKVSADISEDNKHVQR